MRGYAPIPRSDNVEPVLPSKLAAAMAAVTAVRSAAPSATPSSGGKLASVITTTSAAPAGAFAEKPMARSALFAAVAGTTPEPVTDCAIAAGARVSDRQAERSRLFMRMVRYSPLFNDLHLA